MIQTTPEAFKILIGSDGSKQFMIDSERLDESIAYIRKHDLRFIGINSFIGYEKTELDFLRELRDFVEGISVPENHFDISVINELHRLEFLGFADNKKTKIDLSNFPKLSTLACEYSCRLISLDTCGELRRLTLTNYNPSSANITELPLLPSLEELNLFVTKIASLEGIDRFRHLKKLTLFRATRLEHFDSLRLLRDTINTVELDECKRIVNYDVLAELVNLERLMISKSKAIASLSFVKSLENLKFFSFVGTDVIDGDLSPTVGIPYVGFENKRHYSHTFEEISGRAA